MSKNLKILDLYYCHNTYIQQSQINNLKLPQSTVYSGDPGGNKATWRLRFRFNIKLTNLTPNCGDSKGSIDTKMFGTMWTMGYTIFTNVVRNFGSERQTKFLLFREHAYNELFRNA